MSDPGLHSKFVEMQQEDHFASDLRREEAVSDEVRGIRMDLARIDAELELTENFQRRDALFKARKELLWKLRGV